MPTCRALGLLRCRTCPSCRRPCRWKAKRPRSNKRLEERPISSAKVEPPLIWGLSRSSTGGQRAAVLLADRIGANVDTTASVCHGPSIMAIQQVGESTCSLGEVRNRADLVIFWGADPATSHPRHFERYSVDAQGLFVPRRRPSRSACDCD